MVEIKSFEPQPRQFAGSFVESQLENQRNKGWTTTALFTDFDNSYHRKGKEDVTRKIGKITKKYDIPTIVITGRDAPNLIEIVKQNNYSLPEIVVGAVGTEIWVLTKDEQGNPKYERDINYDNLLASSDFDRKKCTTDTKNLLVDDWSLKDESGGMFEFQNNTLEQDYLAGKPVEVQPYKVSYYMTATDASRAHLEEEMQARFPQYEILISDTGSPADTQGKKRFNVDFLAKLPSVNGKEMGGGKHGAANYLSETLGIQRGLKVGDGGNDVGLLLDSTIGDIVQVGGSKEELLQRIAQWFPENSKPIGSTQFKRVRRPNVKDQKAYGEESKLQGPESIVRAAIQRIKVALKFETNESYKKTMQELIHELQLAMPIPVLVFGYGPVLDKDTRMPAGEGNPEPGNEDGSMWIKDSVQATAILHQKDPNSRFFIMGGQTGGVKYASEAEITKREMMKLGIPEDLIDEDRKSRITFENIVNFLNTSDGEPVDFIASSHHISRVRMFLTLFGVPVRNGYKSQELIRYDAISKAGGGEDEYFNVLGELDDQLDVNNTKGFYKKKKGREQETYLEKFSNDNLWMRETLEFPQLFLRSLAGLKKDDQLVQVLRIAQYVYGEETMKTFHLNLSDSPGKLREILGSIQWPPAAYGETLGDDGETMRDKVVREWRRENQLEKEWPQSLVVKLQKIDEVAERLKNNASFP